MKSIKNVPLTGIVCFGILLVFLAVQITSTMENRREWGGAEKKINITWAKFHEFPIEASGGGFVARSRI